MSVTIRSSGMPLDLALASVMTVDDWRVVGEMAKIRIVTRTKRGYPPEGEVWPGYSQAYAERKYAAMGAAPVNLTVSGEMLDNIGILEVDTDHVTLGWVR